jgi:hypothetical protein
MPWPIRWYKSYEAAKRAGGGSVQVGASWPSKDYDQHQNGLSRKYLALPEPRRKPIIVVLPGQNWFCVDSAAYDEARGYHGEGWDVSGEPPNLTVSPSINIVGHYHGYITNGVITDDCDGRTFSSN